MTTPTLRLMPSVQAVGTAKTITVNSRTYTFAAGTTVDAPFGDAQVLMANGWLDVTDGGGSGTTANRPTLLPDGVRAIPPGYKYLDTTLAYVVIYDGTTWRNPSSGASV